MKNSWGARGKKGTAILGIGILIVLSLVLTQKGKPSPLEEPKLAEGPFPDIKESFKKIEDLRIGTSLFTLELPESWKYSQEEKSVSIRSENGSTLTISSTDSEYDQQKNSPQNEKFIDSLKIDNLRGERLQISSKKEALPSLVYIKITTPKEDLFFKFKPTASSKETTRRELQEFEYLLSTVIFENQEELRDISE